MTINRKLKELQELADCANITLDDVFNDNVTMNDAKKNLETIILENHNYNIYYSKTENAWRTYLPDETKKAKRKAIKRNSKENLEKAIVEFYLERKKQESLDSLTLEKLFQRWMLFRRDETPVKDATLRKDKSMWNKFFLNTDLSKMCVIDVKPIVLIRFFRKLTKDRTYTRKSVMNARSILSGMFHYAVEMEIIEHNPINDVDFKHFTYKPIKKQTDNVFTKEQVQKLLTYLKTVNDDPYALAIQLSFCLFVRVGEIKGLKWDKVDMEKRCVYIERQLIQEPVLNDDLTFSKKRTVLDECIKGGTSHGFRKEYLTDYALEILERAKAINPHGEFVFMPYGREMNTDRFNIYLRRYCGQADIPYHSSHKIRFYTASTAYDGTNLVTVSKMMGHSQTATTLHYLRDVIQTDDVSDVFKNLGYPS